MEDYFKKYKIVLFLALFLVVPFLISNVSASTSTPTSTPTSSPVLLWDNVRLTNATSSSVYPTIAWNQDGFGIFYSDFRGGIEPEIYFTKVDKKGNKLIEDKRISYQPTLISYFPDVNISGDNFELTWIEYPRNQEQSSVILRALLDKDGNLIGDIATSTAVGRTEMVYVSGYSSVWNGANYGVVSCYTTNNGAQSDCDFYLTDENGEI